VIMYADKETAAMRNAIKETDRRRAIQVAYNEKHGITPATIQKGISDISDFLMMESKVPSRRGRRRETEGMTAEELRRHVGENRIQEVVVGRRQQRQRIRARQRRAALSRLEGRRVSGHRR